MTCLARGTAAVPEGVSFVPGDRDAPDRLQSVSRRFDAVIDVTRQPGQARRALAQLDTAHWVFVSSGNVYARFDRPEQPESAAVLDPLDGDVMPDMSAYGAAKVACENAVRATHPSHTIIRSGLIGGDGDWSGRSGYYPWRFANPTGADVLVPGDLDFPVALIDVTDLAEWIVDCAQRRIAGTFNATGPTMTLRDLLDTALKVGGGDVPYRPVPAEELAENGICAWMGPRSLPLWIDDPEWRWFATLDTSAARAHGLRARPLAETLAAALTYEGRRDIPRATGLTDDEERALRARLAPPGVGVAPLSRRAPWRSAGWRSGQPLPIHQNLTKHLAELRGSST